MAQNPLQNYFRQPKVFVSLPSKGVYSKPGTLDGDVLNMPVYGMTGMDEILAKTPDALMSGESSAKVLQSCCPGVKNPWEVSVLDTNLLFAAIRIATYGNLMTVGHVCNECGADHEYELDLMRIVEHYGQCQYDNRIVYNNLTIKTQPLNYKQLTEASIKTYELQQKLSQAENIENAEEKQAAINSLWEELASGQRVLYLNSIESIETEETTVTERGHIAEWLDNCDSTVIDSIKEQIEKNRTIWRTPTYHVKCDSCGAENHLTVELDQSNFFA